MNEPEQPTATEGLPSFISLPEPPPFDSITTQRVIGALCGSAVGDALGAPFEFGEAGAYSDRFPEPVIGGAGEMIGGGSFGWRPGEFTDDTQMALALGQSLIDRGGLDPEDAWERLQAWTQCQGLWDPHGTSAEPPNMA